MTARISNGNQSEDEESLLGDSRSAATTAELKLTSFNGDIPWLSPQVDPVILDLDGGGLKLTRLNTDPESELESVSFTMLPGSDPMPTAWLSPEANSDGQRNAAFLVVNDPDNDVDGDVTISSITELLSEFFQAGGDQRSFRSGSAALADLDTKERGGNGDQRLDARDEEWGELKLWFDDGDAITQPDELEAIGNRLSSIDLGSLQTMSEPPTWPEGDAAGTNASAGDSAADDVIDAEFTETK